MAKGKKAETVVLEDEIVTPEMELQAQREIEQEKEKASDISDTLASIVEKFKSEGGSIDVKLKKTGEPTAKKIGRYKPTEFDMDLIAKQYGGGTYFYTARNDKGQIITRFQEDYAEPEIKTPTQNTQNDIVTQVANIMKDTMKEIASIKTELSKPKDDNKENMILEVMKNNQQQQIDILKTMIVANNGKSNQPSMTEIMTMFTTMFSIINKINVNQPQQTQQPQNTIKEVVELATLFADMKENGNAEPQTFMDTIKTFLTDGSLASVIAMLKQPKAPMIKPPQQQIQQQEQIQQPQMTQEQQDKEVVTSFFKQYEKTLFQMKVDGNNAETIAGTILATITMNNDFKVIAYRFFKDTDLAFNSLYENSIEFKNEKEFLKQIVEHINKYFYNEETQESQDSEETQEQLPQGETINEEQ